MDSMFPNGSFFSHMARTLSFVLLVHFSTGNYLDLGSSTLQPDEQSSTIAHEHHSTDHVDSESNQTSDNEIQLRIIEEEITQFASILSLRNNESTSSVNHIIELPLFLKETSENISSKITCDSCANKQSIEIIEKQIKIMQEEISHLKENTFSEKDKERISEVEQTIQVLQEPMIIMKEIEEKLKIVTKKMKVVTITGIAQSIINRQFSFAEKKLLGTDDATHKEVVEFVYQEQADNIDLISDFGELVGNASLKLNIFDALYNEMKTLGRIVISSEKLLQIHENLRMVLNDSTGTIRSNSSTLICNLWSENLNLASETISAGYVENSSWPMAEQLSKDISDHCGFNYNLTVDIYTKVVETIFDKVDIKIILGAGRQRNFRYVFENIALAEAVFVMVERTGGLSTNAVILLAHHLKICMDHKDFPSLTPDVRSRFENIKTKFPISVKNLFFSSVICLKNTLHNEYLYADCKDHNPSGIAAHPVFTWRHKDRFEAPKFKWRPDFSNDDSTRVKITNVAFNFPLVLWRGNEYWNFEIEGNGVEFHYLSDNFIWYLVADGEYDEYRRRVFSDYGDSGGNSIWEVSDCSNFS